MTTVSLAFGEQGYDFVVDDHLIEPTVISPRDSTAITDPHAACLAALRYPIGIKPVKELSVTVSKKITERALRVVIVIADHTRPVPDYILVPAIVAELGVPDSAVTILIGTGTHRGSTPEEIERMLGPAAHRFKVINHNCQGPHLVHLGNSSCGGECWMHSAWVNADIRIATGFIEPHFYAGFSGGSKAIVPGIVGLKTVQHFHRAALIADKSTTWGDMLKNPLQILTREMAALCPPHVIVNVTLNRAKQITGIFCGEMIATHNAGCAAATHEALVPVQKRFPVVVTTNSGYPLDQNFYQTVKGISAAARIVEPGGVIVVVSRCQGGLPDEGEFRNILSSPKTNDELLQDINATTITRHDQWQVQTLLQCLQQARVVLYSDLSPAQKKLTRTDHTEDPSDVVRELAAAQRQQHGKLAVAILPLGPLTIPVLTA